MCFSRNSVPSGTNPPSTPSGANPPSTPESQRQSARHADHLSRLQMTDPDHRRSRSRPGTPPPPLPIQQPNFLANLAANIPQVQIPDSFNAPIRHPMPIVPPMPVISRGRGRGRGRGRAQPPPPPPVMAYPLAMPARGPAGPDDPFSILDTATVHNQPQPAAAAAINRTEDSSERVDEIPQVQLPVGWDAPLANPVPQAPPPMPRAEGRGRSRHGHVFGPLHDISGGNNDPALNGLHRGHIAYRERLANHLADRQAQLLRQLQQKQQEAQELERQLELMSAQEELRKKAETAAEVERQRVAALAEVQKQRQLAELRDREFQSEMLQTAREHQNAELERQRAVQQAFQQERQRYADAGLDEQR
jgi:hypothetical protein